MTYPHVGRTACSTCTPTATRPAAGCCVADPADPAYEHWRELIAEDAGAVLDDVALLSRRTAPRRGHGAAVHTRHAAERLTVHDLDTGEAVAEVPLPGRRQPRPR